MLAEAEARPAREPAVNPNSAAIWLPVVERLGIDSPRTIMVEYDHRDMMRIEDGQAPLKLDALMAELESACEKIGWPCFIRTDLASAKHDGPRSYRASNPASLRNCVYATAADNEMKLWLECAGPTHFMVREFLDLDAPFTAFGGLPVSREWRFFAGGGRAICHHPYWPAPAIEKYVKGPENWRELLADLHREPECLSELETRAIEVAHELGGNWSVDFAMDRSGKWWLIDCAVMEQSWHWPDCPNAGSNSRADSQQHDSELDDDVELSI